MHLYIYIYKRILSGPVNGVILGKYRLKFVAFGKISAKFEGYFFILGLPLMRADRAYSSQFPVYFTSVFVEF